MLVSKLAIDVVVKLNMPTIRHAAVFYILHILCSVIEVC